MASMYFYHRLTTCALDNVYRVLLALKVMFFYAAFLSAIAVFQYKLREGKKIADSPAPVEPFSILV